LKKPSSNEGKFSSDSGPNMKGIDTTNKFYSAIMEVPEED
jgi:hypothetical protein